MLHIYLRRFLFFLPSFRRRPLLPLGTGVQVGSDIALSLNAAQPIIGNTKYKIEVALFDAENVDNPQNIYRFGCHAKNNSETGPSQFDFLTPV